MICFISDYSIIQIASLILSKQCLGSIGILMTSIYLLRGIRPHKFDKMLQ